MSKIDHTVNSTLWINTDKDLWCHSPAGGSLRFEYRGTPSEFIEALEELVAKIQAEIGE